MFVNSIWDWFSFCVFCQCLRSSSPKWFCTFGVRFMYWLRLTTYALAIFCEPNCSTSLLKASSVGKLIIIFPIPVIFVNFLFFNAAPHLRSFFVIFIMLSNITNCFVWYKIFSLFCVQIVSSRSRDTTPSFELFPFQQFHMHRSHCTRPSCHRFVSMKWC